MNSFNNMSPEFGDIVEYLLTDNPRLQTVVPTHRLQGARWYSNTSLRSSSVAFPVIYFMPTIGESYLF